MIRRDSPSRSAGAACLYPRLAVREPLISRAGLGELDAA